MWDEIDWNIEYCVFISRSRSRNEHEEYREIEVLIDKRGGNPFSKTDSTT